MHLPVVADPFRKFDEVDLTWVVSYYDREGDPHSPAVSGFWAIMLGGVFFYRKAIQDRDMLEKYGKGCPDDWMERHVYSAHPFTGLLVPPRDGRALAEAILALRQGVGRLLRRQDDFGVVVILDHDAMLTKF